MATGVKVDRTGVSAFDVTRRGEGTPVRVGANFGGIYMVYNLLAAYAARRLPAWTRRRSQRALDDYHPQNG